ncbi:MAG: adenylate/guanylate cyclase domain-containing protein, partial [Dongiaceae bacterium]
IVDFVGEANGWIVDAARAALGGVDAIALLDREFIAPHLQRVSINMTAVPFKAKEPGFSGALLVFEDITREIRMKGTMVRFMSDTVVQRLLDAGDGILSGTTQDVSILFSDIRGFTSLSERIGATDMVKVLNAYFSDMVDVVFENNGTLDKFIGDAIMAVFGAPFQSPDDADNAVKAAIEMMHRLKLFNKARHLDGISTIDIGVGIDTGSVIAGTIGSPKRMEYTVIGDHVNLASRIESINKVYGTNILISEFTKQRLKSDFKSREIDMVRVSGIEEPVRIYEVLEFHTGESFPNLDECVAAFALGLECYRARAWKDGANAFAQALNFNPGDRPTQIFLSRCWGYLARAPQSDWAGVTDLTK